MNMRINAAVLQPLRIALILLCACTILTGLIYPLCVTGLAQTFFHWQANGSLIERDDKIIGSALIGQYFTDAKYFWPRASATIPFPYNAANSSGSNLGPSNHKLYNAVADRLARYRAHGTAAEQSIPVELVTASGSGLDPEISPEAAFFQLARVARARNIPTERLAAVIKTVLKKRTFYVLGEPRVNVLELNLALDQHIP
jgi:K+-transporting ATPase ATPase C chain